MLAGSQDKGHPRPCFPGDKILSSSKNSNSTRLDLEPGPSERPRALPGCHVRITGLDLFLNKGWPLVFPHLGH